VPWIRKPLGNPSAGLLKGGFTAMQIVEFRRGIFSHNVFC
jgi:hypothetical protein